MGAAGKTSCFSRSGKMPAQSRLLRAFRLFLNSSGLALGLGLEDQREAYFHGIGHPLGALPVALTGPEIQALELGASLEFRTRGRRRELKIDRHVLGDAAQSQG